MEKGLGLDRWRKLFYYFDQEFFRNFFCVWI
jgi:hypothetical protein